jgi:nicotinate phosphoribosyltransferase
MEFGLRRAQGQDGARTAVRAAYIGGCAATSNVDAAREYGVPAGGTHAHSWVLAFPSELEAFRAYAGSFPERAILLVDTYDTLRSGVPNAIRVAKELRERGQRLFGVRLDSGDLAYLSVETRKLLDEAGCPDVKIVASNNLDEVIIHDLVAQGASIDVYGVGTKLTTGWGDPALSGVYKLSAIQDEGGAWQPRLKLSEGGKKATLPGRKQVWRLRGRDGEPLADWIELEGEEPGADGVWGYHPTRALQRTRYEDHDSAEPLLVPVMRGGRRLGPGPPLTELRERAREELKKLHPTMRRLLNPHEYKVSLGPKLKDLIHHLIGVRP